jgi:hypothetical protein
LLVVQERVEAPPCVMEVGFAESTQVGAGDGGGTTVIVVEQYVVATELLAVSSYVVVCVGVTVNAPDI